MPLPGIKSFVREFHKLRVEWSVRKAEFRGMRSEERETERAYCNEVSTSNWKLRCASLAPYRADIEKRPWDIAY